LSRRVIAILLPLAAAVSALTYANSQKDRSATYITTPIERGSIATVVRATGTVNPIYTVDVSSQLSGRMAEVLVNFNDSVAAGQPLGRLDPASFAARVHEVRASLKIAKAGVQVQRAALERSHAALATARTARNVTGEALIGLKAKLEETERQLQRKLVLARTDSVSQADLSRAQAQRDVEAAEVRAMAEQIKIRHDAIITAEAEIRMAEANIDNAEAAVEEKQAELEQAELDLARTELRAPIGGIIIKRDVNPGQTVAVSLEAKTLFKIVNDLREMEVHGRIDEADIGRVKPGQKVTFTVDAHPNRVFTGRVLQVRISPEIVQNVVTYTVVISAPNPEHLLLPGMTADLRIVIYEGVSILKVPNQALRFRPRGENTPAERSGSGSAVVWVIGNDGRPSPVPITIGQSDNHATELRSGALSEGQAVIIGSATAATEAAPFGIRVGL
jgi:HlyD family secretion protein